MKDPESGVSRGFGFITYASPSSAQAILNARPHYIGHHKIDVRPAFPTSEIVHTVASASNDQSPCSKLFRSRRVLIVYNIAEAARNDLSEPAIFGYLSSFGVVKEIVQQFSTSSEKAKRNPEIMRQKRQIQQQKEEAIRAAAQQEQPRFAASTPTYFHGSQQFLSSSQNVLRPSSTYSSYSNASLFSSPPPPPPVQSDSLVVENNFPRSKRNQPNAEELLKEYGYQRQADVEHNTGSNRLLDEMYCLKYQEIKDKYGRKIVSNWTEKTDPNKFVYEDCGPSKQFADLGCGNGLLVFLLSCHGFRGLGLDVRERNIWKQFRAQGADLRETVFDPSSYDSVAEHLKDVDFLVGNHSDELTPWIPVIAARLRCNFFLLPCCTYDFFGKYSRKMPSEKALAAGAPKGIADQHFAYIEHICLQLGFRVEVDQLKIPSRKRKCLVGFVPSEGLGSTERVESVIAGLLSLAKIGKKDYFMPRPSKEQVRNCSKLPPDYRMDLIKRIANFLIENAPEENINGWRCGGSVSLSLLAQKLLTTTDRQMLDKQDKGLQTFLRNQHQMFSVERSSVSMRKWPTVNAEFAQKCVGRASRSDCFFHRLHPDGCPLEVHICSYKH
uniref:tRNA (uracil-O(2)-)-methyltransferase n=1 Tax=Globodera rostochiensis TaxID=31243 RepID=A0A914I843_GLORO